MNRGTMRGGPAAVAALCAVLALPGTAVAEPGELPAYKTAKDAKAVEGKESSTEGPPLVPGLYTDSIAVGEKKYYSVRLDAKSNAWISATALPEPGSKVAYADGVKVALEAPDGTLCGSADEKFKADGAARPLADYAWRMIQPDGKCQQERIYHFSVERESDATSDPTDWPVEIRFMQEPGLKSIKSTSPPAQAEEATVPPGPPPGEARRLQGGTGFNDAAGMGEGNWRDRIRPGQTRFYRVPLDWGQQLFLNAEFGTAKTSSDSGYVVNGLTVDLYNPARGHVTGENGGYRADEPAEIPAAGPPIDFRNRYDSGAVVGNSQFAGWYYLAVHAHAGLAEFVDGTVPVTLRTVITGEPGSGPAYDGDAVAAGFGVTDSDREAAEEGLTASEADAGDSMRTVAWAGIGAGTVLVLGLAVWSLAARRQNRAGPPAPAVGGPSDPTWTAQHHPGGRGYGPPPGSPR